MYEYDIAIVGGGIAGLSAAREALNIGKKIILFENNLLGGKAINGGDIYLNVIFKLMKTNKYVSINKIFKDADLEIKSLNEAYTFFDNENITFVNGMAEIINNNTIIANNHTYNAEHIIIATGNKLNIPNILGINEAISNNFLIYPIFSK